MFILTFICRVKNLDVICKSYKKKVLKIFKVLMRRESSTIIHAYSNLKKYDKTFILLDLHLDDLYHT